MGLTFTLQAAHSCDFCGQDNALSAQCNETCFRCGVVCTGSGGGLVNGGIEWGFDAPSHSSAVYERPLAILAYRAAH